MAAIRPCGSCLTAEFADDEAENDEWLFVAPGSETHPALPATGHLRRPSGSAVHGAYGVMVQVARGDKPYTYCGRPMSDGWHKVAR